VSPDASWLPPQYQLLASLLIGLILAGGAAIKFFRDMRGSHGADGPPKIPDTILATIGAALNDRDALRSIAEAIRNLLAHQEIEAEREIGYRRDVVDSLQEIAKSVRERPRSR
jgi:hypothetical protein